MGGNVTGMTGRCNTLNFLVWKIVNERSLGRKGFNIAWLVGSMTMCISKFTGFTQFLSIICAFSTVVSVSAAVLELIQFWYRRWDKGS